MKNPARRRRHWLAIPRRRLELKKLVLVLV